MSLTLFKRYMISKLICSLYLSLAIIMSDFFEDYIKQIMTGLEGNRQIYLPKRFRIASPRVSIDQGEAEELLGRRS